MVPPPLSIAGLADPPDDEKELFDRARTQSEWAGPLTTDHQRQSEQGKVVSSVHSKLAEEWVRRGTGLPLGIPRARTGPARESPRADGGVVGASPADR